MNPKIWEIVGKMSAKSIELSENSANSGQNVQYFSQMATLFMAFPKYSGHSNQFVTSSWGFFQKFGKFLSKYITVLLSTKQNYKYLVFCWHLKLMPMQNLNITGISHN